MYQIRKERFVRFKKSGDMTISLIKADIECDTAADIPAYNAVPERELDMGSIAWDISTGDFYALGSDHSWYKQFDSSEGGNE